ncbi:hypothetical protein [Marinococcus halotolerans]|uniref:hypothetical protein n=1 Tax=Marinococcus halotolerans TaxID=301092 RepID=UPI0003B5925E|nr:hypothetical protein [Marinococcus halotolerans]
MRIKTFYAISDKGLDKKVNAFLDDAGIEVTDIQFGMNFFYFSAMIVYQNNREQMGDK